MYADTSAFSVVNTFQLSAMCVQYSTISETLYKVRFEYLSLFS